MTLTNSEQTDSKLREILVCLYNSACPVESIKFGYPPMHMHEAEQAIETLFQEREREVRERAFAGGFGAGGGEVYNLELAWKLYDDAVEHPEKPSLNGEGA